ncbi:FAD-dependent oxidoreductase [Nonomuraea sp. NPDC050404]|uniref:NAD(P)/FAD-dependent oxidoreductase n=1 Tax=Nonomuraea sp. NPDC050404 TaxID=3155783 RepID=UPI0033DDE643
MTDHIVVLGAGYAGLGAAKRAAKKLGLSAAGRPGAQGAGVQRAGVQRAGVQRAGARVTLVNAADRFVERVRLHQVAAGDRLSGPPLAELLAGTGIELVVAKVVEVDAAGRTVRLDAAPYTLDYDVLVYALGSCSELDAVPGVREHAYPLATAEEAVLLRERVARAGAGPVTVVGGGLTGIEVAAELATVRPELRVELLVGGRVGPGLSPRARRYLHRTFARMGVSVREHAQVAKVGPDSVLLAGGEESPAGTVVWTAGFRVPGLAAAAGLATDGHGRMLVDRSLRSVSHPEVFGVGDAAVVDRRDRSNRMCCQTALPLGLYAGEAVADLVTGREPRRARFGYVWHNISLGRRDGLVQFTRADDSSIDAIMTGRPSAALKESIIRGTVSVMRHAG